MLSPNESIVRHLKAALLGCIIDYERLNLGSINAQEMAMRAKKSQTSLPFPVLINDMCRWARVSFVAKTDVEITPTSSTDIQRIEAEYIKDGSERRSATPMDTSLDIDVETIKTDTTLPTPTDEP
uniref:Putative plant transposon protein domain-containing protein n=1 Tax=Solanum tuberosum TaxID=4113 RepID=M1DG75_SOLTU